MKKLIPIFLLCGWFICFGAVPARSCNPDINPPLVACDSDVYVDVATGPVTFNSDLVLAAASDDCTPANLLDFRLELDMTSSTPPTDTSLTVSAADIGEHYVVLWALDQSGNSNKCWSTIYVQDCTGDPGPLCLPGQNLTITTGQTVFLYDDSFLEPIPQCWPNNWTGLLTLDNGAPVPYLELTSADAG
ncbi:MAG: hypothetical protein KDC44_17595, partial [Phaeodactylibacter sp.]|nr:hypothetical protein [Phaeodactylibacter sp.]